MVVTIERYLRLADAERGLFVAPARDAVLLH